MDEKDQNLLKIKHAIHSDHDNGQDQKPFVKTKTNGLSNDMVDGIAAVILIALVVSGAAYWLNNMP